MSVYIIAEVGINHNSSRVLALDLMKTAKRCGADAVKFQKRTVDVVYSAEQLAKPRESPCHLYHRRFRVREIDID